ncbi:MAG: hypothetical protein OXG15_09800 [Gammaproteobacteria bacterium]|nr:hypothetical protein [Gammaproteobacteria bacterium]
MKAKLLFILSLLFSTPLLVGTAIASDASDATEAEATGEVAEVAEPAEESAEEEAPAGDEPAE